MKIRVNTIKLAKGIIFFIPIVISVWMAVQYFAVSGNLSIGTNFSSASPFISEWYPQNRAGDREQNLRTGDTYQQLVGEPDYIDVAVPRSYDSVDVTVDYNNDEQPLIEFGLITNPEPWSVNLQAFESTVIDEALKTWDRIDTDGVTLLQRTKQFNSLDEFRNAMPSDKGVGTYRYQLYPTFIDPTYTPSDASLDIDRYFRGAHEFVAYVKNETLHITFDFADMNREFNADPVKIEVYDKGQLIDEKLLSDDGDVTASGVNTAVRSLTVDIPNLAEGAYTLKVVVDNDMVTTHIHSDQEKFVAHNQVYIINNEEYRIPFPEMNLDGTTVATNATEFIAKTDHNTGVQTMTIDDEPLDINTVHEFASWQAENATANTNTVRTVVMPKNDLLFITHGYMAFTQDSFFDPDYLIQSVDEMSTLDQLDHIVFQDYHSPEVLRRDKTQTVHLDLAGVAGDRKKLTFILSAPGLDRERYMIQINHIQFDFQREPLWQRLRQRFHL
ncbi:MAG: hypothetical protein HYV32_00870 [Candidatus Kerfeldbacteria bacterium]|nr:hypothetical protein [Candidatus Kerfeldbacteria bacterium]